MAPKQTPVTTPEDPYRDLIHEVRNLSAAVSMLHLIFVKRKLLYVLLGIETAIVAVALIVMGVFIGVENAHQNHLVAKTVDSCKVRNAQIDATKLFLKREFGIQAQSAVLTASYLKGLHLTQTPQQAKLAKQIADAQNKALHDWYAQQPTDVNCAGYRSGG